MSKKFWEIAIAMTLGTSLGVIIGLLFKHGFEVLAFAIAAIVVAGVAIFDHQAEIK